MLYKTTLMYNSTSDAERAVQSLEDNFYLEGEIEGWEPEVVLYTDLQFDEHGKRDIITACRPVSSEFNVTISC